MPWAHDVHPEFGYLCLAPRMRRRLRRTLACVVFGLVAAAVLQSAHDLKSQRAESQRAMAVMYVDAGSGPPAGSPAERAPATSARTRSLEAAAGAAKAPCGQDERTYLDGKCASDKAPKMRVVRVPTNRPAIAAVPIGRAASTAGPVAVAAGMPEPPPAHALPSAQAAAPEPAAEPAARPVAAAKKPQKTAHNRRREQGTSPAWREVRADAWGQDGVVYGRDRPRGEPFSPFW